jgi:cysteine synthase A
MARRGMSVRDGFIGTIGETPLIKLRRASEETGCTILGKAEFLNPGGSVKDRAALYIIKDAEERGLLRPGGVIVEGTAGNTGIGLALVGNARGYRTVIVMPETQSQEKKDMLRLCGADLRLVPAVPSSNPMHYAPYSGRLAEEIAAQKPNGAIWANQFDNLANRRGHYETTGPEIWEQMEGHVDAFVYGSGTGGTISGVGRFLKERRPAVRIIAVEPGRSPVLSGGERGQHQFQGMGPGFVPENFDRAVVDRVVLAWEEDAFPLVRRLAREEGLFVGMSSGAIVWAAMKVARELGPSSRVACITPDSGARYLTTVLFAPPAVD